MDALVADEFLMMRYRDGDATAFDQLYARHRGGLYRFVLRQCGAESTAQELYQDIWVKLIAARSRYEPKAKFATFLYNLARHRLIDHYRYQARRGSLSVVVDSVAEQVVDDREATPDQHVAGEQAAIRIAELLQTMPEEQRSALLMRQEAGMSVREIAESMSISEEAAKSRLRYAVAKLRKGLGD